MPPRKHFNLDLSYRFQVPMNVDAQQTILIHPEGQQRLIFESRYLWEKERIPLHGGGVKLHGVRLRNDWALVVDYDKGSICPTVDLRMHIIIPELSGLEHVYGTDVSPGAKTFLEFRYDLQPDTTFKLSEFRMGRETPSLDSSLWRETLPKLFGELFWFPVPDYILREHSEVLEDGSEKWFGNYRVPFLARLTPGKDETQEVFFPTTSLMPSP